MDWVPVTLDEVLSEFTPAERTAINGVQGSADNLPEILTRTVSEFRGVIEAAGHELDDEGLVPPSVHPHVVALARWRFLIALPAAGKALQTTERKEAAKSAEMVRESIAEGKRAVESPDASDNAGGNWGSETKINMRTSTTTDE